MNHPKIIIQSNLTDYTVFCLMSNGTNVSVEANSVSCFIATKQILDLYNHSNSFPRPKKGKINFFTKINPQNGLDIVHS